MQVKCRLKVGVISDIAMPDEDGYDLIRKLRESRRDVPAIALTAYAREEDKTRSLSAGFQAHLAKPVSAGELRVRTTGASRGNGDSFELTSGSLRCLLFRPTFCCRVGFVPQRRSSRQLPSTGVN